VRAPGHGPPRASRRARAPPAHNKQDQQETADELGGGEFRAEEDPEHDPELEDEVRRGDHERQGGRQPRAFLKCALCDRDRRVRAARGRRAQPGALQRGGEAAPAEYALHLPARDPGLHDAREQEPEDQRPRDLPGHLEAVSERIPDGPEHVLHGDLACPIVIRVVAPMRA
jgi:hypothetical protein